MVNQILFPNLGISLTVQESFRVFGFSIYWYAIIIVAGMLLAVLYAVKMFPKKGLEQDDLFNMFLIALPTAIICARAYYVIFSWNDYKNNLWQIFNIRGGGLAIYGGVIGATAVVLLYCTRKKISFAKVLDVLAVGLLIGQAVGRWGNFINAEAFGDPNRPTHLPWAMTILGVAENVHPTFLYESLWNAVGILLLLLYQKKLQKADGELFLTYLAWYGLGRFWIEGLREDSLMLITAPIQIRVSQVLAGLSVLAGIIGIAVLRKKAIQKGAEHVAKGL
uniref:Phosphatidylglycerol--prolipoprotein diacylglyceryl transferase n=1 Tax=uncultured Bacillota bacterium TaxID=344338 RepID=A0A650EMJ0_9FIRM|nr:prolipoprotein diacylglyceryl transferase [uncultured Firmicutes bacterium]